MNAPPKFFAHGELLVLPDGKILAHNITPEIAAVLSDLDPENRLMKQRATQQSPVSLSEHSSRGDEALNSRPSFGEGSNI